MDNQPTKWTTLEEADRTYQRFVSPQTGIVHSLFSQLHDVDDLAAFAVGARTCDAHQIIGSPVNELNGGGAESLQAARVAAIGETLERYSAAYVPETLYFGDHLSCPAQDCISSWNLFHPVQYDDSNFPFAPLTETTKTAWTKAENLRTGSPAHVPADLVYLGPIRANQYCPVAYATSNGLACALTMEEASISAVFEALERHAFCLVWHAKLKPPVINAAEVLQGSELWERKVADTKLKVEIFNLSELVGVPTTLSVVMNRDTESAPISFGAAAASTIRMSATKSMLEAFQTRSWIKAEQRENNFVEFESDWNKTIRNFDDHVRLFCSRDSKKLWSAIDFLIQKPSRDLNPERFDFDVNLKPGGLLDQMVRRCTEKRWTLYRTDTTSPDLKDEGVVVVKVLSPDLVQLDSSYVGRFLGNPQLYGPLPWAGTVKRSFSDMNPIPHPFP